MQYATLPNTKCWNFDDTPIGEAVEFRLVYKGKLHAETSSQSRAKEKHTLRKVFHKQLAELWKSHPVLRRERDKRVLLIGSDPQQFMIIPETRTEVYSQAIVWVDHVANNYSRCGYRFLPLARKANEFTCSLDILFLRRDAPGSLIKHGGDIDNRIKVLLDGLKMPSTCDEVGGIKPDADEDPFFCLLEDDNLITELKVTTDRLLVPMNNTEHLHEVELVIRVRISSPGLILPTNAVL